VVFDYRQGLKLLINELLKVCAMTIYEDWIEHGTPHSTFVESLFRTYLFADDPDLGAGLEDRERLRMAFPGYFIVDHLCVDTD
jgi:hypothetical protein